MVAKSPPSHVPDVFSPSRPSTMVLPLLNPNLRVTQAGKQRSNSCVFVQLRQCRHAPLCQGPLLSPPPLLLPRMLLLVLPLQLVPMPPAAATAARRCCCSVRLLLPTALRCQRPGLLPIDAVDVDLLATVCCHKLVTQQLQCWGRRALGNGGCKHNTPGQAGLLSLDKRLWAGTNCTVIVQLHCGCATAL